MQILLSMFAKCLFIFHIFDQKKGPASISISSQFGVKFAFFAKESKFYLGWQLQRWQSERKKKFLFKNTIQNFFSFLWSKSFVIDPIRQQQQPNKQTAHHKSYILFFLWLNTCKRKKNERISYNSKNTKMIFIFSYFFHFFDKKRSKVMFVMVIQWFNGGGCQSKKIKSNRLSFKSYIICRFWLTCWFFFSFCIL